MPSIEPSYKVLQERPATAPPPPRTPASTIQYQATWVSRIFITVLFLWFGSIGFFKHFHPDTYDSFGYLVVNLVIAFLVFSVFFQSMIHFQKQLEKQLVKNQ